MITSIVIMITIIVIMITITVQYPRGPVPYPASEGGQGPSSKYLDEVRFPPKVRQLHAD